LMVMEQVAFRSEDRVGLAAAIILHAALAAILALQFTVSRPPPLAPERMIVSLATEVSLESTAPDPIAESRAAIAPTLAEEPAPAAQSLPDNTVSVVRPPPLPPVQTRRANNPPVPPARTPAPTTARDRSRPDRTPQPRATRAPATTPAPSVAAPTPPRVAPRAASPSGGSRIGENFLEGQGNSARTDETRVPAAQIGASARASIQQALARQVKPHWNAPQGVDVEQLVTLLDFDLDENGRLKGPPRLREQTGVNDSNRAQASRHVENATRAVQLASPFDLPPEFYNAWKSIRGARFDRNLSR
jgi:hypothetical protein